MTLTHLHTPPHYTQTIDTLDASITFPWVYKQMQSGKILAYSNDQLVEEAAIDKKSRIFYGVKSSVNLPLRAGGGTLIGILSFDTTKQNRQFGDELLDIMNDAVDISVKLVHLNNFNNTN